MTKNMSLLIVGFVVVLVMLLGEQGGPLSQMSRDQSNQDRVAFAEKGSEPAKAAATPVSAGFESGWADEPIDPNEGMEDFEEAPSFADLDIGAFNGNSSTTSPVAAKPKNVARAKTKRSGNYSSNQMPAGYVDTNFDPSV